MYTNERVEQNSPKGKQAGVTLNKGQRLGDVMCAFTMFGLKTKRRPRRLGLTEPFTEGNNVAKHTKLFALLKKSKYLAINVERWHTFSLFATTLISNL